MLVALAILAGVGVGIAGYASVIERNWYTIRRARVPCLPAGSAPLRVLSISDLHLLSRQRRKQRFLRGLSRFEPDLVIGTGDYLGDEASVDATLGAIAGLRGRIASLFVLGSNDYYGPTPKNPLRYFGPRRAPKLHGPENPWPDLVAGLVAAGWTDMSNRVVTLDGIEVLGGVEVLGLDDAHIGRADMSVPSPRAGDGFRLAVAHSPDVARTLDELGYDLIVCGHTHGGQVRIPGIGALVTNSELPRSMARGVHQLARGGWLFVNAGLGTNKFAPYRLACRPEVAVLELVARA